MSDWYSVVQQLDERVKKLEAELKRERELRKREADCVDFYADITNWEAREITNDHWEEWSEEDDNNDIFIGGKRARETQAARLDLREDRVRRSE